MNTDLEHMQLRLFRRCWIRWKITLEECADLFDRFKIDDYIADAYEFFMEVSAKSHPRISINADPEKTLERGFI